jgi:hypothetical protein
VVASHDAADLACRFRSAGVANDVFAMPREIRCHNFGSEVVDGAKATVGAKTPPSAYAAVANRKTVPRRPLDCLDDRFQNSNHKGPFENAAVSCT